MATRAKPRRPLRWALAVAVPLATLGLWWGVHTFPWLGSALADGLRRVIGTDAVAWLEEVAYGMEDRVNRAVRSDEAPKAYWDVPEDAWPSPELSADRNAVDDTPTEPPFAPAPIGALHPKLAAPGDGQWVPVLDPMSPADRPNVAKTLIHPDAGRPWAEIFVIAIDRTTTDLHLMLGSAEPKATTQEGRGIDRPGIVPRVDRGRLLLAFNGGFKTQHGRWGISVGGVEIVTARAHGCTIAMAQGGGLRIAPWKEVKGDAHLGKFWRQTPPCMMLRGERNGALWDPEAKGWGAALDGETVIRRSAIGLSSDHRTLYVGVSNHTTAQVMANGMHHAGAHSVAQLDVNWSYPKIVTFPPDQAGQRVTTSLFEGFKVEPDEYLEAASRRDFFYVTKRDPILEPRAL